MCIVLGILATIEFVVIAGAVYYMSRYKVYR